MRKLGPAVAALLALLALPLAAQTDHAAHHHEMTGAPLTQEQLEQVYKQITGREVPQMVVQSGPVTHATKTFAITAQSFDFDVTPQPFAVNVGDTVTLTITVPSSDSSTVGHGFFMPPFVNSVNIPRGQTVTRTFTVTGSPDSIPFVCSQSACGIGHSSMFGEMRVNAAVPNPAPTITSVNPTSVPTSGGTNVSIFGTHFLQGATVKFDTLSATGVSVVSDTQLTVIAPAHAAGPATITVTNPDNQSATSTITYAVLGPSIAAVSPQSGPNSGGTRVTITGSGFVQPVSVTIGPFAASVVSVTDSQVVVTTPVGPANEEAGIPEDVTVTNGDGTSATLPHGFTWTLAPLAITAISPNTGAAGTPVTLRGTGFTTAVPTTVTVGGVAATGVHVLDAVTLSFTAPAHANGTVDVVVTVGSNSVTSIGGFTYAPAPPRRRAAGHV